MDEPNKENDFVEFMLKKAEKKEKPEPYVPDVQVERDKPPSQSREMTQEEIDNVEKFTKKLRKGEY